MRRSIGADDPQMKVRLGKGSWPHTKIRPGYSSARTVEIVGVNHGHYRLVFADGLTVTMVKARELGRGSVAVGDQVRVTGGVSRKKDTSARVASVETRASRLLCSTEEGDGHERYTVANAQQLAIVTALADPPPKTGMIDRCPVAVCDVGMEPPLVLAKADLASSDRLLDSYGALGLRAVVINLGPHRDLEVCRLEEGDAETSGLEALRKALAGVGMVLVGHSEVGKPTLINALVPDTDRAAGEVSVITGKGQHTLILAVSLVLSDGGRVIDMPGARSFDLVHVSPQDVLRGFTDLAAIAENCPYDCEHGWDSLECALSEQADLRLITRTASFRRLLTTCIEDWS